MLLRHTDSKTHSGTERSLFCPRDWPQSPGQGVSLLESVRISGERRMAGTALKACSVEEQMSECGAFSPRGVGLKQGVRRPMDTARPAPGRWAGAGVAGGSIP